MNLTNHFLIAMPAMVDPHFAHTLTYVCEHNKDGALGLVVNKPIDMTLSALFEQIDVPLADDVLRVAPVHFGGPVQVDRGFVLHRPLGNWQSTPRSAPTSGSPRRRTCRRVGRGDGRTTSSCRSASGVSAASRDRLGQTRGYCRGRCDSCSPCRQARCRGDQLPHRRLAPDRGRRARLTRDRPRPPATVLH